MIDITDETISLEKRKTELMSMLYNSMNGSPFTFSWHSLVSINELIKSMDFEEDFHTLLDLLALVYDLGYTDGGREILQTNKNS